MSFNLGGIPAARLAPARALTLSLGALAVAYGSQYWGGLAPCVLCLYQRAAYGAVILLASTALVLAMGGKEKAAQRLGNVIPTQFIFEVVDGFSEGLT